MQCGFTGENSFDLIPDVEVVNCQYSSGSLVEAFLIFNQELAATAPENDIAWAMTAETGQIMTRNHTLPVCAGSRMPVRDRLYCLSDRFIPRRGNGRNDSVIHARGRK